MKLIITDRQDLHLTVEGAHRIICPGEREIRPCAGCFGCWINTPGRCVTPGTAMRIPVSHGSCDQLILVSRCCYGGPSPFVKAVQDRAISYIHPDFVLRRGELHHKRRYQNVITLSACFYGEDITPRERETAQAILEANAENLDGVVGELRFFTAPEEIEEVVL